MPEFSEFFQSASAPYTLNEPIKGTMMNTLPVANVTNSSPAIATSITHNFIDGKSFPYDTIYSRHDHGHLAGLFVDYLIPDGSTLSTRRQLFAFHSSFNVPLQ